MFEGTPAQQGNEGIASSRTEPSRRDLTLSLMGEVAPRGFRPKARVRVLPQEIAGIFYRVPHPALRAVLSRQGEDQKRMPPVIAGCYADARCVCRNSITTCLKI